MEKQQTIKATSRGLLIDYLTPTGTYRPIEQHVRENQDRVDGLIAKLNITDWDVLWVLAANLGLRDDFGGSEYRNETAEALVNGTIRVDSKDRFVLCDSEEVMA